MSVCPTIRFRCEACEVDHTNSEFPAPPPDDPVVGWIPPPTLIVDITDRAVNGNTWDLVTYNGSDEAGNSPVIESADIQLNCEDAACASEQKRLLTAIFKQARENYFEGTGGRCYVEQRDYLGRWWSARLLPDKELCDEAEAGRLVKKPWVAAADSDTCFQYYTIFWRRERCWELLSHQTVANKLFEGEPSPPGFDTNLIIPSYVTGLGSIRGNYIQLTDQTAIFTQFDLQEFDRVSNGCDATLNFCIENTGNVLIQKLWLYHRCGRPQLWSHFYSSGWGQLSDSQNPSHILTNPAYNINVGNGYLDPITVEWSGTEPFRAMCFKITVTDFDTCSERFFRVLLNLLNKDEIDKGAIKMRASHTWTHGFIDSAPFSQGEWITLENLECSYQELSQITFPELCIPDGLPDRLLSMTPDGLCLEFCATTPGPHKIEFDQLQIMPGNPLQFEATAALEGGGLPPDHRIYYYPNKNFLVHGLPSGGSFIHERNFSVKGKPFAMKPNQPQMLYAIAMDQTGCFNEDIRIQIESNYYPSRYCL